MLKVTYYKKCKGTLERMVRSKVEQVAMLWDDIENFERIFESEKAKIIQLNHISAYFAFRLVNTQPLERELWHCDLNGTLDYKIATIIQNESQPCTTLF